MNIKNLPYYLAGALVGVFLIAYALYFGFKEKPEPVEFAKFEMPKDKPRWIMWNKNSLFQEPGKINAMAASVGGKHVPGLNAYVFEEEPAKIRTLVNSDWVIQQEYYYHVYAESATTAETLYRLVPVSCAPTNPSPTPTPNPTPGPSPGPSPNPIPGVNTTWGQKAIHSGEAQIVDTSAISWCLTDTGLDRSVFNQFGPGIILGGQSFVPGEAWDNDVQGRHGTHVSGTIASLRYGVAPKSPGWIAKVLSGSGSGQSSWLAAGIKYCVDRGARVINASWGMDAGSDPLISAAVDAAVARGVTFVAAAGNSGGPIGFPANKPNVRTVTAMNESGQITSFSSRGIKSGGEMYLAPGDNVISLAPGGGTANMRGTSMACPHVTGVTLFALAKQRAQLGVINRGLQPSEQGRGQADALATVQ